MFRPAMALGLTALTSIAAAQGTSNPTTADVWGGELVTGSGQDEHLGADVAIRGDYAYVGAMRYDSGAVPDTGIVYVFARQPSPSPGWVLAGTVPIPVPIATEEFGRWVAIDGNTLVVATNHFLSGQSGRVYVFEGSGTSWSFKGTLIGPALQNGSLFGLSDVSGDRIIVGAPGTASYTGAAYLFAKQGPDWSSYTWQALAPTLGSLSPGDTFGHDIAIDGDIAVIGATGPVSGASNGAVYVFERDPITDTWINVQVLSVSSSGPGTDAFGYGLEIDGTTVLVGCYQRDVQGASGMEVDAGEAFVFTRTGGAMGAGSWAMQATLQRPLTDIQAHEQFGYAVAIDGDRAIVAARGDGGAVGAAYVFGRTGTTWALNAIKVLPSHDSGSQGGSADGFGTSAAFDAARNEMIIGAPTHDHTPSIPMSGGAFVYALTAPPATYCTAKVNSQFCMPSIAAAGSPSVSSTTPFTISAANVLPNKFGLLFYGTTGPIAVAYHGGFLCVKPPTKRTPAQNSGSSGAPCFTGNPATGTYAIDFNSVIQSGQNPALFPGVRVCGQFWYRDPLDPYGDGLTDAVDCVIAP